MCVPRREDGYPNSRPPLTPMGLQCPHDHSTVRCDCRLARYVTFFRHFVRSCGRSPSHHFGNSGSSGSRLVTYSNRRSYHLRWLRCDRCLCHFPILPTTFTKKHLWEFSSPLARGSSSWETTMLWAPSRKEKGQEGDCRYIMANRPTGKYDGRPPTTTSLVFKERRYRALFALPRDLCVFTPPRHLQYS